MRTLALRTLVLLAPLPAALALLALKPNPASVGSPRPCAEAQLIEGELRCDEELVHDLRALCPNASEQTLGPGDAVHACVVTRMPPDQLAALEQVVDLNTASIDELASLPGIGPVLAARIVAGRPYATLEELDRLSGIGPARLEDLRPRARFSPHRSR